MTVSATVRSSRATLWALASVLVLTTAISLAWSRHKLLNQDEVFVLQTDSAPSAGQVLHIQLHTPISLDPPVYHLLVHAAVSVLGPTRFALRLPSLLGFLLMQLCLFVYVRRAAGDPAGLLAAALPALTATLFYSAEARPYGLLLGWFALALAAYQAATRTMDKKPNGIAGRRGGALWTLALAIALALNTHYFAVLLLPPVYAAEIARTISRRKIEASMWVALIAGTFSFAFTIPFQQAAAAFRVHYYNLANANFHAVTQAYRAMLVDYTQTALWTQHLVAMTFAVGTLCFLVRLVMCWRALDLPAGEAAFLLTLAALPFFGYLLAHFVTHSIEVRYVLGAMVAISSLAAMMTAPWSHRAPKLSFLLLLAAMLAVGAIHVCSEARRSDTILASLRASPALQAALRANPEQKIYIQEVGRFEEARYNSPDAELRERLVMVYSAGREIRIDGHDTEALTAEHLAQFTQLPIVTYEQLESNASPKLFLLDAKNGWQWIDRALAEDRARNEPVSPWFGGAVERANFPAGASR